MRKLQKIDLRLKVSDEIVIELNQSITSLKDSESDELFELKGELMPELFLIQICKGIVPFAELWMRIFQRFQVL